MKKNRLSVVISAFNEEKKIADCLSSVAFADEIIIVDCSSIDATAIISKKYTKHVFVRPNNLMLNVNKNFGFSKATGDWVLSLDADERVSPELATEIQSIIENESYTINGYWIPRKNIIFGKWIKHAGWFPDYQLRLFQKGKGKFPEKHVHEMIQIIGETAKLKESIIHFNYDTISQFLQKLDIIYGPNEAEQLLSNNYTFSWADAIRMPVKEFISRFFARQGYKDGFHGLMLSLLMAFYHFIVFAKIWEKQGFKEEMLNMQTVKKEIKKADAEIQYWFLTSVINEAKNPFKKIVLRIQRKLHS